LRDLLDAAGLRPELRTDPARLRPSEIPVAACDPALAARLLGWSPRIPWQQTVADVLDDWRCRVTAGAQA
ncbi:MAG: GDP-6-deoxy-D-lyxo-4-hexulose reductase, partial [Acetobacteraceae bacterium]|nr:GDP-6-deoxy-D-lyxo-4-hexulose reductase [Acetobacteraceae bacterium]